MPWGPSGGIAVVGGQRECSREARHGDESLRRRTQSTRGRNDRARFVQPEALVGANYPRRARAALEGVGALKGFVRWRWSCA